jgi:hypothetical protein
MSRNNLRTLINRANALKSTGPRTNPGKNRSRMNAMKHNLSGQHLVLAEHEFIAYNDACERGFRDLDPQSEPEWQIAQKIVDINFRLNRIAALETNMFNIDTQAHTNHHQEVDRYAAMIAQTRAWKNDAHAFDILGRYEARLSKQLLQYQKEIERLQAIRKADAAARAESAKTIEVSQPAEIRPLDPDVASFGKPVPPYVMHASETPIHHPIPVHPDTLQPPQPVAA